MPARFLDLQATGDDRIWTLPLTPAVCVGPPDNTFMYGGVGLGASLQALETVTGRTALWGTAQYLSYARVGQLVDLHLHISTVGRRTTQARVIGRVGEEEIFVVAAALTAAGEGVVHQWAVMPPMPPPDQCVPAKLWPGQDSNLNGRLEVRMAQGLYGHGPRRGDISPDGRLRFWMRTREDVVLESSILALFADYVPSGVGVALGREGGGNSLDNTLRLTGFPPTRWILCDVQIAAVNGGVAQGAMNLFAETGELVATASQSMIVRFL